MVVFKSRLDGMMGQLYLPRKQVGSGVVLGPGLVRDVNQCAVSPRVGWMNVRGPRPYLRHRAGWQLQPGKLRVG